jgi:carboxylesterase
MASWTRVLEATITASAAVYVRRELHARSVERAFEARYGDLRNVQGVIAGAEGFTLEGTDDRAIVLLHGYNDSPQTMRSPAAAFHAAGWTVIAPLLPGHGRTLRAFAQSGADDWMSAGRGAAREALKRYKRVAIGGLSMGGAIATIVAAEEPGVQGAVLFAPFLVHNLRLSAIGALWPVVNLWTKYLTGGRTMQSVRDPAAREAIIAYGCSTPRLLYEIRQVVGYAREKLPAVKQPVFMAQSADDYRIPAHQAQAAFDQLGSTDKHLHWSTGNGHVITVDYGHEKLAAEAMRWIDVRMPKR